jgi:dipeptidase
MDKKTLFQILGVFMLAILLAGIPGTATSPHREGGSELEALPEGCTVILVGKAASTDGSVMVTHTADCGMCDWAWRHIPAAEYEEGAVRRIYHINQFWTWPPEKGGKWERVLEEGYTGFDLPQVPRTNAYIHGVFGYMNEHQLAFGESSIGCRRKMRNPTPTPKFDITMLTLLAMERCSTAREAITLMGELAEEHGYGHVDGGEMLAVADPQEAWIFEIMPVGPLWTPDSAKPGAVWCAQRVPDDHVSFCPNESRIGEVDVKDKDNFLASPNVISFAVEQGFYDPDSGESFNWKKAYSPTAGSAADSQARRGRLWRLFDLAAPSRDFQDSIPNMDLPFSVKPDNKLSLKDVIALMRDKYQGTKYDPAGGIRGGPFQNPNYFGGFRIGDDQYNGPRCVSVNKVEYTTVAVCRDWLPDPIGGVVWLSFGAQDTSCYMPIYAGSTRIPHSFSIGDHWVFDRKSARWAFDYVDFHTQVIYSHAIQDVKAAQAEWEDGIIDRSQAIDQTALELHKQDPALAVEFLTDYTNNNAHKVIKAWWDLGDELLVKYNHFRIYDPEKRRSGPLQVPDWWNKAVVEQDGLTPLKRER